MIVERSGSPYSRCAQHPANVPPSTRRRWNGHSCGRSANVSWVCSFFVVLRRNGNFPIILEMKWHQILCKIHFSLNTPLQGTLKIAVNVAKSCAGILGSKRRIAAYTGDSQVAAVDPLGGFNHLLTETISTFGKLVCMCLFVAKVCRYFVKINLFWYFVYQWPRSYTTSVNI